MAGKGVASLAEAMAALEYARRPAEQAFRYVCVAAYFSQQAS